MAPRDKPPVAGAIHQLTHGHLVQPTLELLKAITLPIAHADCAKAHGRNDGSDASSSTRCHLRCLEEITMTVSGSQSPTQTDDNRGLERGPLPLFVWLGGTVLLVNVSSAVLSLMA